MKYLVLPLVAAVWLLPSPTPARAADAVLDFLEEKVRSNPRDFVAWNKLGDHSLQLLRTTGDDRWLAKAASAADASLQSVKSGFNAAGYGLRGRVELARHHFREAVATGKELQALQPDKVGGLVLICDGAFELGDYKASEEALATAVREDGRISVGSESRAAKFDIVRGRLEAAAAHLELAVTVARQELTTPDTLAWCEVQLGELAFKQGNWELAEKHYLAAGKALPGWYVTEEHLAELRGAQGRYEEAQAAYEKLVARVPRPELFQEFGDLLVFAGQPDSAKPWYDKARALYEGSIAQGETMYLHHASGFYADSVKEPVKALETAQKDIEQRQSIYAWDSLAWAQYGQGQMKEAAASIEKALATGVRDPHILYHAGMIRISAGDLKKGQAALRETVAVNPRYQTFHVHR